MALAGGGFFGSGADTSKNDASTIATETGIQAADEALALSLGGNTRGRNAAVTNDVDVFITKTDFGAIEDSLLLAAGTVETAFDSVEQSIQANEAFRENLFEFTAGAIQNQSTVAGENVGDAIGLVDNALNKTITASTNTVNKTFEATDKLVDDAFTFGAGTIQELVGFTTNTLDKLVEGNTKSIKSIGAAQERTITAVSDATRSDTAQNFEKLVQVAGFAFVALAAITLFIGRS